MYQTSHYSCNNCTYQPPSRLEYIAYSQESNTPVYSTNRFYSKQFYSKQSEPHTETYLPAQAIPQLKTFCLSSYSTASYSAQKDKAGYDLFKLQPEYNFIPEQFLKPGMAGTFVGKAEEVKPFVEEAFQQIFEQSFPNDIKLSILDEKTFKKIAPSPHANTIGLSINRSEYGLLSEIFVLNDTLGKVMLTIGHELGHVLSPLLDKAHDEEAKAYAFSLVWMRVIKEHNIANLGEAIIMENPAENGLHDVAFRFVNRLAIQGKDLLEIYLEIVRKMLFVENGLE